MPSSYRYFDADDTPVRQADGRDVPEALGRDGVWRRWAGFSPLREVEISEEEAAKLIKARGGDISDPPSSEWVGGKKPEAKKPKAKEEKPDGGEEA